MEMRNGISRKALRAAAVLLVSLLAALPGRSWSQEMTLLNGRMYITLNTHIGERQLDSFVVHYDLGDLDLREVLFKHKYTKLRKMGWRVEAEAHNVIQLSKQIMASGNMIDPGKRMGITEEHPTSADLFPAQNDNLVYGFNKFVRKFPFLVRDSMVTFFMRGHRGARQVLLAGSFTNWQNAALSMSPTDSGWTMVVKLGPGKYWYKFIIDGGWTPDPDNELSEDDLRGNINSVYYKTNTVFTLNRFLNARQVYLAGSFNQWDTRNLGMARTIDGWRAELYLSEGTHRYKYFVDGVAYQDPNNSQQLPDGHRGYNSVLRIGKSHLFKLKGYGSAQEVILSGTFDDWHEHELPMKRTETGWALSYTLGPGNYEYKFIVDGKWIVDPENPYFVRHEDASTDNSYLIIGPNHTFHLPGFDSAQRVYLAGDFNNWTPDALQMKRIGNEWVFPIHLSVGKHLYKYIVDGKWIIDPSNPLWEGNEYNTQNSVIWTEH